MVTEIDLNKKLRAQKLARREQIKINALRRAEEINAQRADVSEMDGFKITAEQCGKINAGEIEAINKFFIENKKRLINLARTFLTRSGFSVCWDSEEGRFEPKVLEVQDCLNQLYVDMLSGYLIFALVPKSITSVIGHSFLYAGVGGFGDEDGVYFRGLGHVGT